MEIIPMPTDCLAEVRALYRACHPTWPELPASHFLVYPTVIAVEDERIAGYEACHMNVSDSGHLAMYLDDIGVAEWARGRGIARALHAFRFEQARENKAKCVVGVTQPDNAPMVHIFRTEGFDEIQTIPSAYPDGRDGVLFILRIEEH